MKVFKINNKVSFAVPRLDHAGIDNKIFFICINCIITCSPKISTKYGILNYLHLSSELILSPNIIDTWIFHLALSQKIAFCYISAEIITTDATFLHLRHKNLKTSCLTYWYSCIKTDIKCSIEYYWGRFEKNDCTNYVEVVVSIMYS